MTRDNRIAICFVGSVICVAFAFTTPFGDQAAGAIGSAAFLSGAAFGLWWA